jgi:hypothetical protein
VFSSMLKYELFLKSLAGVTLLVVLKVMADHAGWSVITINTLTSAFFGGVFFVLGIIMAGVVADFKEAEKVPSEFSVLLKAIRHDSHLLIGGSTCSEARDGIVIHVEELLQAINDNFRHNHWHKHEVDQAINDINADIVSLWQQGAPSGVLIKMRDNLTGIDRLSHRVDYISKTSFLPAAYFVVEIAVLLVLCIFILARNEWGIGGMFLFSAITFVLVSLIQIIRDIDNPFEVGKNSLCDVDLSVLFKLEILWQEKRKLTCWDSV